MVFYIVIFGGVGLEVVNVLWVLKVQSPVYIIPPALTTIGVFQADSWPAWAKWLLTIIALMVHIGVGIVYVKLYRARSISSELLLKDSSAPEPHGK